MADMTNVDAAKLRQTGQKINDLAGDLNGIVGKINDVINNLNKSWQSDVATQFMKNWQVDRDALQEMVDQYREVADLMVEMAQDFESTEEDTSSIVAKLLAMR